MAAKKTGSEGSCLVEDFLAGGGKMGALIRSMDWSKTSLGAIDIWSPALRMMARLILANRLPLMLWWGPRYCQLYNDPYRPVLGNKHPASMGQSASKCFPEIWDVLRPLIDTPFSGGSPTCMDDLQLEYMRYDHLEEVHFSVAFSPVPDESTPSGIGGVLATVHEITENVVRERRVLLQRDLSARTFEAECAEEACMRAANTMARHSKSTSSALLHLLQRDLGARSSKAKTVEEACKIAAKALAHYSKDVPFALLYLIDRDRKHARLASVSGIAMGQPESQIEITLDAGSSQKQPWPLAQAFRTERMQVVENLQEKLANVPPGPWSDPPISAVVCPMRSTSHQLAGLLVLGVSSRLRFDERYRDFCELVADGVTTAIAHARADDPGAEKGQMILSGF